jgi:hypothetical protein
MQACSECLFHSDRRKGFAYRKNFDLLRIFSVLSTRGLDTRFERVNPLFENI